MNLQNRHAPCTHRPFGRQPSKPPAFNFFAFVRSFVPCSSSAPGPGHRPPRPGRPTELSMHERMPAMAPSISCSLPCRAGGRRATSARSSNITRVRANGMCRAFVAFRACPPCPPDTDANAWRGSGLWLSDLRAALHAASDRLHACMHHSVPCRMACNARKRDPSFQALHGQRCRSLHKHLALREDVRVIVFTQWRSYEFKQDDKL